MYIVHFFLYYDKRILMVSGNGKNVVIFVNFVLSSEVWVTICNRPAHFDP